MVPPTTGLRGSSLPIRRTCCWQGPRFRDGGNARGSRAKVMMELAIEWLGMDLSIYRLIGCSIVSIIMLHY